MAVIVIDDHGKWRRPVSRRAGLALDALRRGSTPSRQWGGFEQRQEQRPQRRQQPRRAHGWPEAPLSSANDLLPQTTVFVCIQWTVMPTRINTRFILPSERHDPLQLLIGHLLKMIVSGICAREQPAKSCCPEHRGNQLPRRATEDYRTPPPSLKHSTMSSSTQPITAMYCPNTAMLSAAAARVKNAACSAGNE